jgi:RNA polymerase sigma-70 factor (ECF subfamily)
MSILLSMWKLLPTAADSEQQLIASARRGERDALNALYRRHAAAAYTLALRLCRDADRAHDIVQDAFLRAFDSLHGYRADAVFSTWLKRIVANIAIDYGRRERRFVHDEDDWKGHVANEPDPAAQHDALGLLARLPDLPRAVLVLHAMEGYSHQEIALLLGRTEGWSKTVLARTRATLAEWLRQSDLERR